MDGCVKTTVSTSEMIEALAAGDAASFVHYDSCSACLKLGFIQLDFWNELRQMCRLVGPVVRLSWSTFLALFSFDPLYVLNYTIHVQFLLVFDKCVCLASS